MLQQAVLFVRIQHTHLTSPQGRPGHENTRTHKTVLGWPEPYIYTVYDRILGDFPAMNTVYTPYIYGSGQP
jgi:hypothetical protein